MDITHPNDVDAGLATCLRLCIFDDNWMRRSLLDAHLYISTPLKVGNVLVAWDDDSTPVGWMSYAYFNDETREAFMRGDCLREEDWHSGEEFWVVDFLLHDFELNNYYFFNNSFFSFSLIGICLGTISCSVMLINN